MMTGIFFVLIGVVVILALLYLYFSGQQVPETIKIIIIAAACIYLLLCVLHNAGCVPPYEIPVPH